MKTIVKMQFGSHIYGTNLPTSDLDFKQVHLPTKREIILQRCSDTVHVSTKQDRHSKNTENDIDIESFSLKKYLHLLLEGQTVALDMLFTPSCWYEECDPMWETIKSNKHHLIHKGTKAFVGYCRTQTNKYGIKGSRVAAAKLVMDNFAFLIDKHGAKTRLKDVWDKILFLSGSPHIKVVESNGVQMLEVCNKMVQETANLEMGYDIFKRIYHEYGHRARLAETNDGIDWKAVMHAIRVSGEAEELLTTGHITFPRPNAEYLLKVRRGLIPFKEVSEVLDAAMNRIEEVNKTSTLPEKGDSKWVEEFVYQTYLGVIG